MSGQPTPPRIIEAFGADADPAFITTPIPVGAGASGRASFNEGFPPITMTPVIAGGVPPFGQDVNGILNMVTAHLAALNAGQPYVYDATLASAIGGYKAGVVLGMADGTGLWMNYTDGNTSDPDASGAGWVGMYRYRYEPVTGLTGGVATLTRLQAASPVLVLSGTLVANLQVVLPATLQEWLIVNTCTGSFTVTVKTASGTGVDVASGGYAAPVQVYGDGTNIYLRVAQFTIPGAVAPDPNTYALRDNVGRLYALYFNQSSGLETPAVGAVIVESTGADGFFRKIGLTDFEIQLLLQNIGGVLVNSQLPYGPVAQHAAALFTSPAFTGVPTAPTAAPGTSNTQVATTAFANPGQSIAANGYVKLPGGLILQWGSHTFGDLITGYYANTFAVAFPIPFPNAVLQIVPGKYGDGAAAVAGARNATLAGFQLYMEEWTNPTQGVNNAATWFAIGY